MRKMHRSTRAMRPHSLPTRAVILFLLLLFTVACAPAQGDSVQKILDAAIDSLNIEIRDRVNADRTQFSNLLSQVLDQDSDLTVLVDKSHDLPEEYVPKDLVQLDSIKPRLILNAGSIPLEVRRIMIADLQTMVAAAKNEGVILDISSAYRSYKYQKNLFARYTKELGKFEAERQSAHAGSSQHQLGLALDFGSVTPQFAQTNAGKWLAQNAGTYGFSLSYPAGQESYTGYIYEPWHWRYIGRPAAELQKLFFGDSQHHLLIFLHEHAGKLRRASKTF